MSDEGQETRVQYVGLSSDGDSIRLQLECGKILEWTRSKLGKHFSIVGGYYNVKMNTDDGSYTIWCGTATFDELGEMTEAQLIEHGAGEKKLTMKKLTNKVKREHDEKNFGQLTLNDIRDNAIHYSKSEKAALIAKIVSHVGVF